MSKVRNRITRFSQIFLSLVLASVAQWGCGVKSKPLPPDKPVFIGHGQKSQDPNLPEALNPELIEKHIKQNKEGKSKKPPQQPPRGQ